MNQGRGKLKIQPQPTIPSPFSLSQGNQTKQQRVAPSSCLLNEGVVECIIVDKREGIFKKKKEGELCALLRLCSRHWLHRFRVLSNGCDKGRPGMTRELNVMD